MSPLVRKALQDLEGGDSDTVGEGLLMLGEVVAANCVGGMRPHVLPEVQAEFADSDTIAEIQRRVRSWIESNANHDRVMSAFFVLEKFEDPTLIPFLRDWLARYVESVVSAMRPVGQILVALRNLGEDTISGGSWSHDKYGKNLDDAVHYLAELKRKS